MSSGFVDWVVTRNPLFDRCSSTHTGRWKQDLVGEVERQCGVRVPFVSRDFCYRTTQRLFVVTFISIGIGSGQNPFWRFVRNKGNTGRRGKPEKG